MLYVALVRGLHFDQARQVRSVFHTVSVLPAHGRLGAMSVGASPAEAEERYEKVVVALVEEPRAGTE